MGIIRISVKSFYFKKTSLVLLFECVSSHKILENTKQFYFGPKNDPFTNFEYWQIIFSLKITFPLYFARKLRKATFTHSFMPIDWHNLKKKKFNIIFSCKIQNSHFYSVINACHLAQFQKKIFNEQVYSNVQVLVLHPKMFHLPQFEHNIN